MCLRFVRLSRSRFVVNLNDNWSHTYDVTAHACIICTTICTGNILYRAVRKPTQCDIVCTVGKICNYIAPQFPIIDTQNLPPPQPCGNFILGKLMKCTFFRNVVLTSAYLKAVYTECRLWDAIQRADMYKYSCNMCWVVQRKLTACFSSVGCQFCGNSIIDSISASEDGLTVERYFSNVYLLQFVKHFAVCILIRKFQITR